MNPVGKTAPLVAAIRAEEHARADRLFDDPFAHLLAGDEGRRLYAEYRGTAAQGTVPIIEVRTRWYDEAVLASPYTQVVLLAAGMDARAYRLSWRAGTRLFELDQPAILDEKARLLAGHTARCDRVAMAADLAASDWPAALVAHGFDRLRPTLFVVEGLIQYLHADAVETLFTRVDGLALHGSRVLFDVIGRSLLETPILKPTMDKMADLGAAWLYGNDRPESLLPSWRVTLTQPSEPGNAWHRWPFPTIPPEVPNVPRSYFVIADKPPA